MWWAKGVFPFLSAEFSTRSSSSDGRGHSCDGDGGDYGDGNNRDDDGIGGGGDGDDGNSDDDGGSNKDYDDDVEEVGGEFGTVAPLS